MPEKKKDGLLSKLKAKNRKKKLAKAGVKESDLYNKKTMNSSKLKKEAANEVFNNGGKIKKKKEPLKNKVKRKIAHVKNRKVEKAYKRTRNTDLQDKPRSGNTGVYSKGGFIQYD